MDQSELLRLAGIAEPSEKQPVVCPNDVKYCLMAVIEYYNSESEKYQAVNISNVYRELITQIDDIIGCVARNCKEQAVQKFKVLDNKVKQDICKLDSSDCCRQYFCYDRPKTVIAIEIKPEQPVAEAIDKIEDAETLFEPETVDTIKVPREVISDIKTAIKELDDGLNYYYISHLDNVESDHICHSRAHNALEIMLKYLTDANPMAVKLAATYLAGLDSDTKYKIPTSVWKYLTVDFYQGDSLKSKIHKISNEYTKD
jgi:hypothetical protein